MPNNLSDQVTACLDSNVIISAIAFGGKPLEILDRALSREFHLVMGPNIVQEVRRNLIDKLELETSHVDQVLQHLIDVASVFVPSGKVSISKSSADNLVLEVAQAGDCDVLVTGDTKDLLPLGSFESIIIEPPSKFLIRLNENRENKNRPEVDENEGSKS